MRVAHSRTCAKYAARMSRKRSSRRESQRRTKAGSPRRRYTEPKRASIRSHAGSARTRTISSAGRLCRVIRQETHCGQGEYTAHRDLDVAARGADGEHFLVEQRRGRPVRAAVLLRQLDAPLRQVQHDPRRHVVDVGEAAVRRQGAAPCRVHREAGVDVTAAVHRTKPMGERVGARAQVGRSHPTRDDPARQHVETRCDPGHHQAAVALPQPDDGGVVESHRPFDERREVLAVGAV